MLLIEDNINNSRARYETQKNVTVALLFTSILK